jgi:hypothetical protein
MPTRQIVLGPRAASGKPARLLSSIPFQNELKRKLSDKSGYTWPSCKRRKFMKRALKHVIRTLGFSLGLSGLIIAAAAVPATAQKK